MFKTRLRINRVLVISFALFFTIGILFVVSLLVLVPSLTQIYFPKQNANRLQPIDTNAVNTAIELLNK